MTKDEALKMAIEALSQDEGWFEPEKAIQACKEALEQPKEPQYLYVCKSEAGYLSSSLEPIVNTGWKYIGKIKLEVDND